MNKQLHTPPVFILRLFRWFCNPAYQEDVEGDLLERFDKNVNTKNLKWARWLFIKEVLLLFRPGIVRSINGSQKLNNYSMFKHNFILIIRNFKRHKSSFFINLFGLTTGLACTLLIYLWVADELSIDKFHTKDAQLFRVMEHQQYADNIMTTWSTPGLLADALKEDYPEIKYATTTTWIDPYTLTYGDKNLKADGFHVGKDFFNIFSYNLIEGKPDNVMQDRNSIVISDELAVNLFGSTENLIGKSIQLKHNESYLISGVFEKVPGNSTQVFDFVFSFEKYRDKQSWLTDWDSNGPSTYIILNEGAIPDVVSDKIAEYVKGKAEDSHITLFLRKYSDLYLYGNYENGKQAGGRINYVKLFSIIAIFILLIACINFMNLSTARASRRAKEVGVKKAVGAPKSSIINQYLTESLVLSLTSYLAAMLVVYLFLPQFNDITGKAIAYAFNFEILFIFLIVTVVTGLVSGSYPALYMSGFTIVKVLKGQVKGSFAELWARKGLVVFQFTLSIILIVSVTVIYKQIDYVQNKHLGYEKDNVIYFQQEGKVQRNPDTFIAEISNIPGIVSASSIAHNLLHRNNNTSGLNWEGKNPEDKILFENVRVNYNLIETLGMELVDGRSFSKEFGADSTKVIFNEAAIAVMNMQDPIGKSIRLWEEYDLEIIGVVKDFNFQSLHEKVKPLFFVLSPYTYNIMARIEAGKEKETLERLDKFYTAFNPGFSFEYKFIDDTYQKHYAAEQRVSKLSRYFAGMAIIISCLGLFGLANFTAERRQKEIGVEKYLDQVFSILYIFFQQISPNW